MVLRELWLESLQGCAEVLLTDQLAIQLGQEELKRRPDRRRAQVAGVRLVLPGADADMGVNERFAVHQRDIANHADDIQLLVELHKLVLLDLDVDVLEMNLSEA